MTLEINLNPDEQSMLYQLAAAAGQDVESYLYDLVQLQLDSERDTIEPATPINKSQWRKRLDNVIALHPRVGHVDESRDAIYGDHGQ